LRSPRAKKIRTDGSARRQQKCAQRIRCRNVGDIHPGAYAYEPQQSLAVRDEARNEHAFRNAAKEAQHRELVVLGSSKSRYNATASTKAEKHSASFRIMARRTSVEYSAMRASFAAVLPHAGRRCIRNFIENADPR
jgi:hypothetical protein